MKIYILVLCLIIIFLKYKLSKNNVNKKFINNKFIKYFNVGCLPFVIIILTYTFSEDFFYLLKNEELNVYSHIYTEPADF
tara:strand:+ start:410 stop:649 length:240 start_codon:yes stop_codon:yes gene_type:complete